MKNTITRTMTESTIHGYSITIQEGGEPTVSKLEPITVYGKVSKVEAFKELKKANPESENITVGAINECDVLYEISVDDFVKYAKKIEKVGN